MISDLKITGVFPKTDEEVLETHTSIKELVKKEGIRKPKVLISISSGIAYVVDMLKKKIPQGNIRA